MTVEVGLLVTLDAKPGKEVEVAAFPNGGLLVVEQEPGTVTWYAIRHGDTTFGIFDTFGTDDGRQAHLSGAVAKALGQVAGDLFALAAGHPPGRHPGGQDRRLSPGSRAGIRPRSAPGVPAGRPAPGTTAARERGA